MSDKFTDFQNELPDYVTTELDFENYKMRHSTEHVLTQAVISLYGKDNVVMAMGPATEEGFYFDFELKKGIVINESDFAKIEFEMEKIIKSNLKFIKTEVTKAEAKRHFKDNQYKLEWIEQYGDNGLTVYKTGDKFIDLCKGPHVDSTSKIGAFKLLKLAGAYWHGDEKNKMLTRIYGTVFKNISQLNEYILLQNEAKKRDHKKIAKELDLIVYSKLIGSGLPVYTPKGTILRNEVYNYSRELNKKIGYSEVATPNFNRAELFKVSGHYEKYKDSMFKVVSQYSDEEMFFKPMNCPQHTQIYASQPRSYKDLPYRVADFSNLARDEKPGVLNGLLRSRVFTVDDGHCFCTEEQIKQELKNIADVIKEALSVYGLKYKIRLSLWDPKDKTKYLGDSDTWEKGQKLLKEFLDEKGYEYFVGLGEAAIYGPKIDFIAIDALKREWQISTIQIDLIMPVRFGLEYIASDGTIKTPVMIHRAIVGSERFIGIIIEHFAGSFPAWLSPEQVRVIPISSQNNVYANKIIKQLEESNIRAGIDADDERMQNKIRKAQEMKIPFMVIIGKNEEANNSISLRYRSGEEIKNVNTEVFISKLLNNIKNRVIDIKII